MASNKKTIYLGLDYSDFTGGVTEVNRKMGLLDAEFKLAQEQIKNYGTETDNLSLKQEYLTQKIELQKKKVYESQKAYDEAINSNKSTQKQIDALDKKLLQEKTSLEKLNGQLKENADKTDKAGKETKSFGDEIRNCASALGVNISPALENAAKKLDGVSASVGNAVLGIGVMIAALVNCSTELATYADDMLTMSSVTGIATDELQKLEYAANFVDVEVSTMTSSVTKLTSNMRLARDGNSDLQKAFSRLHVSIKDGNGQLKDANEVFYKSIDALGRMQNETERDALAMQIFGRSARELNPLIEAGSDKLKELGVEAENLGLVLSEDALKEAGAFKDELDRMGAVTDKLKLRLGQALLPVLEKVVGFFASIPTPVYEAGLKILGVVVAVNMLSKALGVFKAVQLGVNVVMGVTNAVSLKTVGIVLAVVAAVTALIALIALLSGKKNEINDVMNNVANTSAQFGQKVNGIQSEYSQINGRTQYNASGTKNYSGGRTWVGEAGPEIIDLPPGTRITPNSESRGESVTNYYVTISAADVKEFNDIVRLAQGQRMAVRRGTV